MNAFIDAYVALYGGTKDNARQVWRNTNTRYHHLVNYLFLQKEDKKNES